MAKIELRDQRLFDYLNNYRFHVIDVTFGAPSVLNLSYGFARVSMPELTVETREIKEGVLENKHFVAHAVSVGQVVLERGVSIFNSDFSDWIIPVIRGVKNQRRNLLLVQFSDTSLFASTDQGAGGGVGDLLNQFLNFSDLLSRLPARAWMLYDCIPVHYKAGSDLDALGNEISIAQLTVQPHFSSEIALGVF